MTLHPDRAYESVKPMINKLVRAYQRKHGGEWFELLSCANEGFMKSLHSYKRRKSQLTTWVWWHVRCALKEHLRRTIKHQERFRNGTLHEGMPAKTTGLNLQTIMLEASPDAAFVAKLVLDGPVDVTAASRDRDSLERRGSVRKAIVEYLRDIRWSYKRIVESFWELRKMLS